MPLPSPPAKTQGRSLARIRTVLLEIYQAWQPIVLLIIIANKRQLCTSICERCNLICTAKLRERTFHVLVVFDWPVRRNDRAGSHYVFSAPRLDRCQRLATSAKS